jgi:exonuclease SbcD
MGHLYMVGTRVSELSERKILGGNQHALPETLFPDDVAYVALGHLHQLQHVGDRKHVMYCGAPLPLSLKEAVRGLSFKAAQLVELADGKLVAQRPLMIPQVGEFLRVPDLDARGEDTFAPLEAVLEQLKSLPALDPVHPEARPFLEVCVALEKPEPLLKHQVEDALVGKAARLVRLQAKTTGTSKSLAEATAHRNLKEISPEEVFRAQWSREHQGAVPEPLLKAFHELIEAVGRGETP